MIKRNIVLVGCPKWDQEILQPANDPIKGYSNLMYTMHFMPAHINNGCVTALMKP